MKIKSCILCLILLFAITVSTVSAVVPYDTYTYSGDGTVMETAHAYVPGEIIGSETVSGMGSLTNPSDLFIDSRSYLYIVDKGNNRVVVLDDQNRFIKAVDSYEDNGQRVNFREPSGIYVTDNGEIYVADTANGKVVAISEKGETLRILRQPETDSWDSDYPFRPISVAVDSYGKVYVVAMNVTLGVIVYDTNGNFETFLGAQKVTYDLLDYLWRQFMTEEQLRRMTQFVPTEYTSLDVDPNGFVYAVSTGYAPEDVDAAIKAGSKDGRVAPIRKLNPGGYDILLRQGYSAPVGDLSYPTNEKGEPLVSSMVDVALGPAETYTMLDTRFGRLFTYSQRGDLLFVFGGKSAQNGNSQNPVAVEYRGNDILVLDSQGGQVTTYHRTEYASLLIQALEMYDSFDYEGATKVWEQIIESNPNLDIAYDNVGQALLRQREYDAAMKYFEASNNQALYSEAWSGKRTNLIRQWFVPLFIIVVVLLIGFAWLVKRINRFNAGDGRGKFRYWRHFVYAFYVIIHPFKGFWDIKHEKRGSAVVATSFYLLAFLSDLFSMVCTAFIFNTAGEGSGLLNIAFQTTGASLIFVVANWCLTSLMDGEGSMKDIYTNVGYALVPMIMMNLISVPLSYVLVQAEGMYLTTLASIGTIWTLALIFCGVLTAQQYGFIKNIITCLLSIVGMAIIIFVALLCINMYSQIFQFIGVIFFELFKR